MSDGEMDRAEFASAWTRMHSQGAGLWEVQMYRFNKATISTLLSDADDGDAWAMTTLVGLEQAASRADERARALLCFTCDNAVGQDALPAYFVRVRPKCDAPTLATIQFVCDQCAERVGHDEAELTRLVVNAFRTLISPDAREVQLHWDIGHA